MEWIVREVSWRVECCWVQTKGEGIMGKASELSSAERRRIVLMILRKEEPLAVLSRRFNVSETALYRWKDDFLAAGEEALAYGRGKANGQADRARQFEKELAERDRVIGELTIANRILKKTSEGLS